MLTAIRKILPHFSDGLTLSMMAVTIIMMKRFGLDNTHTALFVSLLALPAALRPLMELTVARYRDTSKVWILTSLFVQALLLWTEAFTMHTAWWKLTTVCLLMLFFAAGTLHRIAKERFYTRHDTQRQGLLHNAACALSLIAGAGYMTMLGGNMEVVTRNVRYSWCVVYYSATGIWLALWIINAILLPGGPRPVHDATGMAGISRENMAAAIRTLWHGSMKRQLLPTALCRSISGMSALAVMLIVIDASRNGGCGLSPQEWALTLGTVGVIGTCLGAAALHYANGKYTGRYKPVCAPAALCLHLATALYMSHHTTSPLLSLCTMIMLCSMFAGCCFAACKADIHVPCKEASAPHVALKCVTRSSLTLCATLATALTGVLLSHLGYRTFFLLLLIAALGITGTRVFYILMSRKQDRNHT